MRKFVLTALCFVFALTMSSAAFAQPAEIVKGTPVIDGVIDSVWDQAPEYEMNVVLEADYFLPIEGDADLSGTWKALWDEDNFYLLVQVKDDIRVDDSDAGNQDDAVELLIASSGADSVLSTYRWGVGESKAFESYSGPPDWADLDDSQVKTAIHDAGDSYVLEAAIAWSNLHDNENGVVTEGQTIHLDVHVVDDDSEENKNDKGENPADHSIAWIGPIDNMAAGSGHLGTATLVAGSDDASGSASPGMPKTGLGGTESANTAWMLLVVLAAAAAGVWMYRARTNQ